MSKNPIREWRPAAFFKINLLYLVILGALLTGRQGHWLWVDHLHDPIGGLIPIGVPWFGALGAVVISMYGVFDHNHEWNTKWNYWHLARPFVGAIFGVVAFMIFVGLINATGTDAQVTPSKTTPTGGIAYLVLAFVVGFREETFRLLVKRAVDILLGPGIPGETPPSVSVTVNKPILTDIAKDSEAIVELMVANNGTADIAINSDSGLPAGFKATVTKGDPEVSQTGLTGQTVAPGAFHTATIKVKPTKVGEFEFDLQVNGSFGSRTVTVRGAAI